MAYVVIQHLSPRHESKMPEILAHYTRLPILVAREGMTVEPDHVYLIPVRHNLSIAGGVLHLEQTTGIPYPKLPIDRFFHALGEDQGERGVAIILSGTGSDGSRGLRSVKQAGGLVLVQEPDQAEFSGMPLNALATRMVDHRLRVEEMPALLLQTFSPGVAPLVVPPPLTAPDLQPPPLPELVDEAEATAFRGIVSLLTHLTQVPFEAYKTPTLLRRTQRRMNLYQIGQFASYLTYLLANPGEQQSLAQDWLIGVTQFFRDPEAFDQIRDQVLPACFAAPFRDQPLRIWVCGCATGEEAYSLAILLDEYMQAHRFKRPVQIFASDVSQPMIEQASLGLFPEEKMAALSHTRRTQYFVPEGPLYRILPRIRDQIVFSRHNVLSDPPFIKLDFISCRNLLIYLQGHSQAQVLETFHLALKPNRYLWLGPSETVSGMEEGFDVLHARWKLLRRKVSPLRPASTRPRYGLATPPVPLPRSLAPPEDRPDTTLPERYVQRLLLQACVPDGLVLDEDLRVVYVSGRAGRFLSLPQAQMDTHLSALLAPALVQRINQWLSAPQPAPYQEVTLTRPDQVQERIILHLRPLGPAPHRDQTSLLLLELQAPPTPASLVAPSPEVMDQLELTLQAREAELQSMLEEIEALTQEVRSLHHELGLKASELAQVEHTLEALLASPGVTALVLTPDLRLQYVSPAARDRWLPAVPPETAMAEDQLQVHLAPLLPVAQAALDNQQSQLYQGPGDRSRVQVIPFPAPPEAVQGVILHFLPD